MDEIIKILTEIESSSSGIYRKFMTTDEITICNKLVKDGMLYKGKPDEKNATIAFYITSKGSKLLENQK
jgi:predicted transcriptional regulator